MTDGDDQEAEEKATVMKHMAVAAFPADHLAPWMGVHKRDILPVMAALRNIGSVGTELERRAWLDEHPDKELPEELKNQENPDFDKSRVRGAAGMFAYCTEDLAMHWHDLSPSIDGLGRRQAMGGVVAQKTGVAVEPKKRSLLDKLRGKNSESSQITGGSN